MPRFNKQMRQTVLRIRYWDEEDATFNGVSFRDLLFDDIFRTIEEAGGPVTATDMMDSLRNGRMANYLSQMDQPHRWSIPSDVRIEDVAQDLSFTVERPKHRKTGKPLNSGWTINV